MKKQLLLLPVFVCILVTFSSCYDNADPNWDQRLGIKEKTNYLIYNEIEYPIVKIERTTGEETFDGEKIPFVSVTFYTDTITDIDISYTLYNCTSLPYEEFSIVETGGTTAPKIACEFNKGDYNFIIPSGMFTIEEVTEYGVTFTNFVFNHAIPEFTINGKVKDFK